MDLEDYPTLSRLPWTRHISKTPKCIKTYAICTSTVIGQVLMHRLIMVPRGSMVVDHINGNGLDNRKSNLRVCSTGQNMANKGPSASHGFKGVTRRGGKGPWIAEIAPEGHHIYLGIFRTIEEAARAYDVAARKWYGEFAYLNFPDKIDEPFSRYRLCPHGVEIKKLKADISWSCEACKQTWFAVRYTQSLQGPVWTTCPHGIKKMTKTKTAAKCKECMNIYTRDWKRKARLSKTGVH